MCVLRGEIAAAERALRERPEPGAAGTTGIDRCPVHSEGRGTRVGDCLGAHVHIVTQKTVTNGGPTRHIEGCEK